MMTASLVIASQVDNGGSIPVIRFTATTLFVSSCGLRVPQYTQGNCPDTVVDLEWDLAAVENNPVTKAILEFVAQPDETLRIRSPHTH